MIKENNACQHVIVETDAKERLLHDNIQYFRIINYLWK